MTLKSISMTIILPLCLHITNCASAVTYMSPLKSELVTQTTVRQPSAFKYTCELGLDQNRVYLTRTPYCPESAETSRIAKKSGELALPVAIVEIPIYGLGLLDLLGMYAISEESKVALPLGKYDTGVSLPCGKTEIASGESMVIRNDTKGIYHEVMTDTSGEIELTSILGDGQNDREIRIHLKYDPTVSFSFVY